MTQPTFDVAVDFDYDDPDPDQALAWLSEHYFNPTPGFVEAYVEGSFESSDLSVEGDLVNNVRAHFSVVAESAKDAVRDLFENLARLGASCITGVAVDGNWLDANIWDELLRVLA